MKVANTTHRPEQFSASPNRETALNRPDHSARRPVAPDARAGCGALRRSGTRPGFALIPLLALAFALLPASAMAQDASNPASTAASGDPTASPASPANRPSRAALPRLAPLPPERPHDPDAQLARPPGATQPPVTRESAEPQTAPQEYAKEMDDDRFALNAPLPPERPVFPGDATVALPAPPTSATSLPPGAQTPGAPASAGMPSWWPFGRKAPAEAEAGAETALPPPSATRGKRPPVTAADVDQCVARLRARGAEVVRVAPVSQGNCGVALGVEMLSLAGNLPLSTSALMTCPMAEALSNWYEATVKPAARTTLKATVSRIVIGPTYHCRTMNHQRGGKLSEHAFGNAVDIAAFEFDERATIRITPKSRGTAEGNFQNDVHKAACTTFDTVLGPGSDGYHEDHLHLDLRNRGPGRQICR